jgi:arginase
MQNRLLNRLTVFGSAFHHGQSHLGVERTPGLLSTLGIARNLRRQGNSVRHRGMVYPQMKETVERTVGFYNQKLAKQVYQERKAGRRIINIGGDNSVSIGSINGILEHDPDTIVIWVDAHPDINTQDSSPSGNIHGMPLAYLTGLEDPEGISRSPYLKPKLRFDRLAYIGIRDINPYERYIIEEKKILNYSRRDSPNDNIYDIMDDLMEKMDPKGEKPIHLMFDIDAVDPYFAPGTGTPVHNGLHTFDAKALCEYLAQTKRVISMDMVEVNPYMDREGITTDLAMDLIERTFANPERRRGAMNYGLYDEPELYEVGINLPRYVENHM